MIDKELIKTTFISNRQKFVSIRLNDLDDGILIGIIENGNGISIAYKGEVKVIKFIDIDKITKGN